MKIITLLTDFGIKDGNVAVMKGVIWQIASNVQIVDISHMIQPQNIKEASLILFRSAPFFPPESIHVIVVDPGVGTIRRPIAAKVGHHLFICPDNGILSLILQSAEANNWETKFVHLDKPKFWLPQISHVFHGRDIFAPVAAHIANGTSLQDVGSSITDIIRIPLPIPKYTQKGLVGEVIYIDSFGNIASNIEKRHIKEASIHTISICGIQITGLSNTFGEKPTGEIIALFSSTDHLGISMVNGNAAQKLSTSIGDIIEVALTH